MKKIIKMIILVLISLSVYFIYKDTSNKNIKILNIGDGFSIGINSYGIDGYSYADYYRDYLKEKNKKIEVNESYSYKEQSIKMLKEKLKSNGEIKKDLINCHLVIICLGFNDLMYRISIEQNINNTKLDRIISEIKNDYDEMITEIRKYYKGEIIVIGYGNINIDNYYVDNGIRKINRMLKNNKEIEFIDIYKDLNSSNYFLIPGSFYPDSKAYQLIASKIIEKTLEK